MRQVGQLPRIIAWCTVNKTLNQLDATITIYWSPRSPQHVSGNFLPIFRSVRLRVTACGIVSWCCSRLGSGERQRDTVCTTLPLSRLQPTATSGHYTTCRESQSYPLEDGQRSCPKHVELILEINKLLLLHLVGLSVLFTYIDDARSNPNQIGLKCLM